MADDEALADEVRAQLPALEHAAKGRAGEAGVKLVIGRRFALYPQPERPAPEWAEWWAAYVDVLADVPLASLEAAMRAYVAEPDSEFLPKPGKLRAMALETPTRSARRFNMATEAIRAQDAALKIEWRPKTPQEIEAERAEAEANRQAILAMAKDTLARIGDGPAKPKRELPSIAGKTDATGITPQMRALMENRP